VKVTNMTNQQEATTDLNISFVKVVRNCQVNKAGGENAKLIYDFDVLLDGVKIARWVKDVYKRGYTLADLDGLKVKAPYFDHKGCRRIGDDVRYWHMVEAEVQSAFAGLIIKEFDYIPAPAQIRLRQQEKECCRAQ
jgi:hypothetical protein